MNMEPNVEIMLSQVLDNQRESFIHLLNLCGSPIERILLLAFLKQNYLDDIGYIGTDCLVWIDSHAATYGQKNELRRVLYRRLEMQYVIREQNPPMGLNVNYRLDFALFYERSWGDGEIKIAIECDGHNFHEKTKEQARRDKSKDRYLQSRGWVIARFTGSEIVEDSASIVDEIEGLARKKDEELHLAAHPELEGR
jgi:very-short-patch-repair endonuclease